MKINLLVLLTSLLLSFQSHADIATKVVDYSDGEIKMKGYLAYDDSIAGQRPGIIVVHEWWGHNDYVKKRARMLAKLGYNAIAILATATAIMEKKITPIITWFSFA